MSDIVLHLSTFIDTINSNLSDEVYRDETEEILFLPYNDWKKNFQVRENVKE